MSDDEVKYAKDMYPSPTHEEMLRIMTESKMIAKDAALDHIAIVSGIYREDGESDDSLKKRVYKAVSEGPEAKIRDEWAKMEKSSKKTWRTPIFTDEELAKEKAKADFVSDFLEELKKL